MFIGLAVDVELTIPALPGSQILRILVRMNSPSVIGSQDSCPGSDLSEPPSRQSSKRSRSGKLTILTISLFLLFACAGAFAQDSPADPYSTGQYNDQYQGTQPAYPYTGQPMRQPLNAGQLEQLIAPIALYPDPLVAQVLVASTYPAQVMEADSWRREQAYATPDQIAYGADTQPWDPSVKALTAFPQVLAQLDRNLQWTTDLGNAYYNQPQDVLEAVQVMRRRSQAAGYLRSTPQEAVRYDEGNIELVPADPQVVYVPTYNPWAVYGDAVSPYPGFSLLGAVGGFLESGVIRYGLGIALSAFARGTPWGWLAWGLDWLGQALTFHDSPYYAHGDTVADWGFSHRGFHAYSGRGGFGRGSHEFAGMGRGGESWRHAGGFNSGGWHSFGREPERHAENWGRSSNSGRSSGRGFGSFHNDRGSMANASNRSFDNRSFDNRSVNRMSGDRGQYRSAFNRGRVGGSESYRAANGNLARNDFGGRSFGGRSFSSQSFSSKSFSSKSFSGKSSGFFGRASSKSSSSGHHLFGGGHAEKSFGGGSSHFGGGHAPKAFGGSKGFGGGGHSHGGGGHSGGHGGGGGKHHR